MKSTTSTLRRVIQSQGGVTAVTSLGDDVFVARKQSARVEIYDARTFTFRGDLQFPKVSILLLNIYTRKSIDLFTGLAACPDNKCLYASCNHNDTVHRVELSGSNAVNEWTVASGPRGLSVNSEHNLIVTCSGANKLQEYATHGSLLREICLQAGVTWPWHAIQLSTGDYVVSQWTSSGVVSVVRVDRQVIHSYGQSQTSNVGQMKCPTSLAVTKNDDILVAVEDNNRIMLISSSLGSIRELSLPGGDRIQEPRGLCLDESRGRLYVGEYGGQHRVLVFNGVTIVS